MKQKRPDNETSPLEIHRGRVQNLWEHLVPGMMSMFEMKLSRSLFLVLLCAICLTTLFMLSTGAQAKTITVDDDGGADYETIPEAMDAAEDGDTIEVFEGTYTNRVEVKKQVNLVGAGAEKTIIDGDDWHDELVVVSSNWVNISGFTITGGGTSSPGDCTLKLEADNCNISDCLVFDGYYCIYLFDVENCTVSNTSCSSGVEQHSKPVGSGIYQRYGTNNTLENNSCWDNKQGIKIQASGNTLLGNNCSDNRESGIMLLGNDNVLSGNKASGNGEDGIYLYSTTGTVLEGNTLEDCGITITGEEVENWNTHEIAINNTVNGKSVLYLKDTKGSTVETECGQLILANCENVLVQGLNCSGGSTGIVLAFSSGCDVRNSSSFFNTRNGLHVYKSDAILVSGITGSLNGVHGVYLEETSKSTVEGSRFSGNKEFGIGGVYGTGNFLSKNTYVGNFRGIYLWAWEDGEIRENNCSLNKEEGILLDSSHGNLISNNSASENDKGFKLVRSENCTLENNTSYRNEDSGFLLDESSNISLVENSASGDGTGISLQGSSNITLRDNLLQDCEFAGIHLSTSKDNLLEKNDMTGCGILFNYNSMEFLENNEIDTSNTVNRKPVRFLKRVNDTQVLSGAGQVILVNTTRVKVDSQDCSNTSTGILVAYSSETLIINSSTNHNSWAGVNVFDSQGCRIQNTSCHNNTWAGVVIGSGQDNILREIRANGNGFGVFLQHGSRPHLINISCVSNNVGLSAVGSDNGTFTGISIRESSTGINLNDVSDSFFSGVFSHSNTRHGVAFYQAHRNSLRHGSFLDNREAGIHFAYSTGNEILNSTISENGIGIKLGSYDNSVSAHYNQIFENRDYGVRVQVGYDNFINASHNWWGDESGPRHETENPGGLGDNVSDDAEFRPWLESMNGKVMPWARLDLVSPDPAKEGETIQFKGRGSPSEDIDRYRWNSSIDGVLYLGEEGEFSSSSLSLGEHVIYLRVRDDIGVWSDADMVNLIVSSVPEAEIVGMIKNPTTRNRPVSFQGKGYDDRKVVRYAWTANGEAIYNGSSPEFTTSFPVNGSYSISLRAQDDTGFWSEEVTGTLVVSGFPRARIDSINPSLGLLDEGINFRALASDDGSVVRYVWRSDLDFEFYNDSSPVFQYSGLSLGFHNISLRVQDDTGFWSEEVGQGLLVHQRPSASVLGISPSVALVDEEIVFAGKGSDDGEIVRYVWSTSLSGEIYNGTEPGFTLATLPQGTHEISFKVMDDNGAWSHEVWRTVVVHKAPVAQLDSIGPNPAIVDDSVLFSGSGEDDGGVIRYIWNSSISGEFYNGTEASFEEGNLPLGTHLITFRVYDIYEVWSTPVNTTLVIHQRPVAFILSISPSPAFDNDEVYFQGQGEDAESQVTYIWSSSLDGELYRGPDPSFSRFGLSCGAHEISLWAVDELGSWSTKVSEILVVGRNKQPQIDVERPKNGTEIKGTVTIAGTAKDPDGSVERVEFSLDGKNWTKVQGKENWSFELDTTNLKNGEHVLILRGFDDRNASSELTLTLVVANEKKDDDGDGFGFILLILAFVVTTIVLQGRRKIN